VTATVPVTGTRPYRYVQMRTQVLPTGDWRGLQGSDDSLTAVLALIQALAGPTPRVHIELSTAAGQLYQSGLGLRPNSPMRPLYRSDHIEVAAAT